MTAPTVALFHKIAGPTQGFPVVFLHGFPLDHTMWSAQADALAGHGYRVVLPDLRGHGRSPTGDEGTTIDSMAADVHALLDRIGVRRYVLAGFSLGGYVALQMAATRSQPLAGLVLVDTRAEPDTPDGRRARLETIENVRRNGIRVVADAMMPKFFTPNTARERTDLVAALKSQMLATPPDGAIQALRAMADRPDQRPTLSRVACPTLVVVGAEDAITPPEASRTLASAIPGARLEVIPGAAHLAPLERPEAFNAVLADWISTLEPQALRAT